MLPGSPDRELRTLRWILRCAAPVLILFVLAPTELQAYQSSTTISGSVQSSDAQPIPDVRIQWTQDSKKTSLTSDSAGRFFINFVAPGRHVLRFEHSSVQAPGVYEFTSEPDVSLCLQVVIGVLPMHDSDASAWSISERACSVPEVWKPERVLTEESVESLPGTGHLWSILGREPSVVAERFDIAGMHSQRQLLIGVRGSSWTQNQAALNGLDIGHPGGDGMIFLPDMSAMEAVIYTIGDSPASHSGPGAHISMISKTGGRMLHGEAYVRFQAGALQNVNPTERNRFFGITESDERWRHFVNGGFQLGGPLGNLPWSYFGAVSVRALEKRIRNHETPVSADQLQGTLNLTGRITERDDLGIYWSRQRLHEPQANASPQVTRAASLDQLSNYQSVQLAWTRRISPISLMDVRLGSAWGRVSTQFQNGATGQSRENIFAGYALYGVPDPPTHIEMVDMLSNTLTGPAPLAVSYDGSSTQGSARYATNRRGFWNSQHRLSVGAAYRRASMEQDFSSIDQVNLLFFEGFPNSVRMLNTPAHSLDRVSQWELHASDAVSFGSLSIAFGLSADLSRGASLMSSGREVNGVRWTDVAGRMGVAYQPMRNHSLVLRAGAAQIFGQPLTSTWDAANPEGLGSRLYSWDDSNQDGQFQPGEEVQILKLSGAPFTNMDMRLKNPKTTELTLGLDQDLTGRITLRLSAFRRFEHRMMSLVNVGVPFSSYAPVETLDPGKDGILNSEDDRYITVYNQNPETLGQDRYLLTNPEGHNGLSEGFEARLRFSFDKIQAEAIMTRYRAVAATAPGMAPRDNDTSVLLGVFDNPNNAIFARGSTFFDRGTQGRLWATWEIGCGTRFAVMSSYQDGLPYSRYLPVKGLNQGVIGILIEQRGPGEGTSTSGPRTSHYQTTDLRLTKDWELRRGRLSTILDVFNLANLAQPMVQTDVTAPTHYWRIPLRFETPRSLQLGLHYNW